MHNICLQALRGYNIPGIQQQKKMAASIDNKKTLAADCRRIIVHGNGLSPYSKCTFRHVALSDK